MTQSPLIAGLDVGTSNIKALIAEPNGTVLSVASIPTPSHHPLPGRTHYNPDEIWAATVEVLKSATAEVEDPHRITGIAVASVGETGYPVDKDGLPTHDAIAWFDTRSEAQAAWLKREIGDSAIYETCRMPIQPIFGLCKLLWLRDNAPDAFLRTATWLNTADYIAFRLSGEKATDPSLASRTLCFDISKLEWSAYILDLAGLSLSLMPPIRQSGEPIGHVRPDVADQTGLPSTCRVSAGGHDHVCGALGVGVVEPGTVLNSLGTAEAVFLTTREPVNDSVLGAQGYSVGGHVVRDRYYTIGGLYSSGGTVDWVTGLLGHLDRQELLDLAKQMPPGSGGATFLPHLWMSNPPYGDAPSRAAFVGLTGDTNPASLYRAVLEGIAFESHLCLNGLASVGPIDRIVAIGGSTRNDLLMEIKANVYGRPVTIAKTAEAVALGAAILGGLGAGVYVDIDDVIDQIRIDTRTLNPDPALVTRYADLFENVYTHLYPSLSNLSQRIHDTQGAAP